MKNEIPLRKDMEITSVETYIVNVCPTCGYRFILFGVYVLENTSEMVDNIPTYCPNCGIQINRKE